MKLSRMVTGLLTVALLAFMVTDSLGQRPQGGGGRGGQGGGGRGGFGGFGGGRGGGDMTMGLLRIDAVKTELEVSPDQEEALTKLEEQNRPGRPDVDFRNMSEEERAEFFEKMRAQQEERTAKMKEQLEEVLFPEQIERLEQIGLQIQGVAALNNKNIAAKLDITEAQTKELADVRENMQNTMRDKMREIFSSGDRENMREKINEMRKDMEGQVLAVLTPAQKTKFEEMKGKPFEMPEGSMGRGGFGGRGGPGGPGGGRGNRGADEGGRRGGGEGGRRGGGRQRPEAE